MLLTKSLEIPFKKLNWVSNTTPRGESDGVVLLVADFMINNGVTFCSYYISNLDSNNVVSNEFYAYGDFGKKIGKFNRLEEAKNSCQLHFQSKIFNLFFDFQ